MKPWGESQKESTEVFYKKICSYKFHNIHKKTPMLESLFNKVAALQACSVIKRHSNMGLRKNFKKTYFGEHLRTAASEISIQLAVSQQSLHTSLYSLHHIKKFEITSSISGFSQRNMPLSIWHVE